MDRSPLECPDPECGRRFGTRFNLERHVRCCHLKLKMFVCHICGFQLASKQAKQEHLYIHSGEKPYKCRFPGCMKRYRQSSQLSVHKKVHMRRQQPAGMTHFSLELPPVTEERKLSQQAQQLPCLPPR